MKVKQWITTGVLVSVLVGHWLGVGLPVQAQATAPTDTGNITLTQRVFLPVIEATTETQTDQGADVEISIHSDPITVTQEVINLDEVTAADYRRCPYGWICLAENQDFGGFFHRGRMLKWSDPGTFVNLTSLGFNDQMSAWANRTGLYAKWYNDVGGKGAAHCMTPYTTYSRLGPDNDKASSFQILRPGQTCR